MLCLLLLLCLLGTTARQGALINDVKAQLAEAGGVEEATQGGGKRGGPRAAKAQAVMKAISEWITFLKPQDYNATHWKRTIGANKHGPGQPGNFFAHYTKELSQIFRSHNAEVNFVLVGACDGTHDKTIAERFLVDSHWVGVFVEPVSLNFKDLTELFLEKNVMNRSHLIKAAATDVCKTPMTKIKFPIYETKSPKSPHWLRREIGAVLTPAELSGKKKLPNNWNAEDVRCVTARDILDEWTNVTKIDRGGEGAAKRRKKEKEGPGRGHRRRPMVLKIDAEGHDYQVLMGFVAEDVPVQELPLLISFEAKSIRDHYNETVAHLQRRGYVVSETADDGQITNDGFALLRGQNIRAKLRKQRKGAAEASSKLLG